MAKEFSNLQKAYDKMKAACVRAAFKDFKKLCDKVPRLVAISWYQYTPTYNDGENCEFSLGELSCKIEGFINPGFTYDDAQLWPNEEAEDNEEDGGDDPNAAYFDTSYLNESNEYRSKNRKEGSVNWLTKKEYDLIKAYEKARDNSELLLEPALGNNVRITLQRSGEVSVTAYECGY